MKQFNILVEKPILPDGSGIIHTATSWELRSSPDITKTDNILHQNLTDTINLLNYKVKLDVTDDDVVYVRTKLHFGNDESKWSNIVAVKGSQKGYKLSNYIVATPIVSYVLNIRSSIDNKLELVASEFRMYLGYGKHIATSWTIKDTDNRVIYMRPYDRDNLTSLSLDLTILNLSKAYIVEVVYHTDTNVSSRIGKVVITEANIGKQDGTNLFDIRLLTEKPTVDEEVTAEVIMKTLGFKSADLKIENFAGEVIGEANNQPTIYPSIVLQNIEAGAYVNIYGRIRLEDGTITGWKLIYSGRVYDQFIVDLDPSITYLDKFTYEHDVMLKGYTVQCSRELANGMILLAHHNSNTLKEYRIYGSRLTEVNPIITIPLEHGMKLPYINILPMYKKPYFVLNYGIEADNGFKNTVWELYKFSNERITKIGSKIISSDLYSTAMSRSAVCLRDNKIYYIPARHRDDSDLALYTLNPFTMETQRIANLPFSAKRNVGLTMTKDNREFLVFGGSTAETQINNEYVWTRSNNNVYIYSARTNTFRKIAELPSSVDRQYYCFQGMLRRDGKIALFNATDAGEKVEDQMVLVVDTEKNLITKHNIDYADKHPYRNLVTLLNGDALRISSKEFDPQPMHRYISNTVLPSKIKDATSNEEPIETLTIESGTDITIETPYKYRNIRVMKGGTLRWLEYDGELGKRMVVIPGKTLVTTYNQEQIPEDLYKEGWDTIHVITDRTLSIIAGK